MALQAPFLKAHTACPLLRKLRALHTRDFNLRMPERQPRTDTPSISLGLAFESDFSAECTVFMPECLPSMSAGRPTAANIEQHHTWRKDQARQQCMRGHDRQGKYDMEVSVQLRLANCSTKYTNDASTAGQIGLPPQRACAQGCAG